MKQSCLDEATVKAVVEHMNTDHQDACLAIVQSLGGKYDATRAEMLDMDEASVVFLTVELDGNSDQVRVEFAKPITRESQIRGHLVALTKQARAVSG